MPPRVKIGPMSLKYADEGQENINVVRLVGYINKGLLTTRTVRQNRGRSMEPKSKYKIFTDRHKIQNVK